MAKTPIVDKGYFISNDVKRSIVLNLCETKSMDLIAREHCVSPTSVARILRLTEDRRRKNYLPRILSIDEFKSVNTVDASMSVNLTDDIIVSALNYDFHSLFEYISLKAKGFDTYFVTIFQDRFYIFSILDDTLCLIEKVDYMSLPTFIKLKNYHL